MLKTISFANFTFPDKVQTKLCSGNERNRRCDFLKNIFKLKICYRLEMLYFETDFTIKQNVIFFVEIIFKGSKI